MRNSFFEEKNPLFTGTVSGSMCGAALGVSLAVCGRMFGAAARLPLPKKIIRAGAAFGLIGGAAGLGAACIGVTSLNFFVNRAAKEQEKAFREQQRKQIQMGQTIVADNSRARDEHVSSLKN